MRSFADFGRFMQAPDYWETRKNIGQEVNQFGANMGDIGATIMGAYNAIKAQDIRDKYKKAKELKGDFKFDKDAFTKQYRDKKTQELLDSGKVLNNNVPEEISRYGRTYGPTEEVALEPGLEFQIMDDGSTFLPVPADIDPTGMRFAPEAEIPLVEGREFQVLEDRGTFFPYPEDRLIQESDLAVTPEMLDIEERRAFAEQFGEDMTLEDYKELRDMYKPGMKQSEEYYHLSTLLRPYDPKAADKLEDKAYEQAQFEEKLLDEKLRAAAKLPREQLIEVNKRYSTLQRENEQALQQFNMLNTDEKLSDVGVSIQNRINSNNAELKRLAQLGEDIGANTPFQGIFQIPEPVTGTGTGNETGKKTGKKTGTDAKAFEQPVITNVNEYNNAVASVNQAVADNKITSAQGGAMKATLDVQKTDIEEKQREVVAKAEPKRKATEDWKQVTKSSAFIKARNDFNAVENSRKDLVEALERDLTPAEANQLAFKIARVVTGPGVLTESEVLGTQNRTVVEGALDKLGLSWLMSGTEWQESNVKDGIRAALKQQSGRKTAMDNYNDFIKDYNERNPKFKRNLIGVNLKKPKVEGQRRKATAKDLENL